MRVCRAAASARLLMLVHGSMHQSSCYLASCIQRICPLMLAVFDTCAINGSITPADVFESTAVLVLCWLLAACTNNGRACATTAACGWRRPASLTNEMVHCCVPRCAAIAACRCSSLVVWHAAAVFQSLAACMLLLLRSMRGSPCLLARLYVWCVFHGSHMLCCESPQYQEVRGSTQRLRVLCVPGPNAVLGL
ncbi:hypothetical protein COO60DRAFT_1516046, partial [Scenedesmus sp. NREL 46B-D3]